MSRRELNRATEPPLKAVTFDVTGTLIHAPRLAAIYCQVLTRHGLPADEQQVSQTLPEVWDELSCRADPRHDRFSGYEGGAPGFWHRYLERLCERLDLGEPTRFASAELFDRLSQAESWEIYEDVMPTLEMLWDAGLRTAAISNWDRRLYRLLERLDLVRWLDVVVDAEAVGVEKPHPEIFQSALEQLRVEPARVLHVGDDSLKDIEGALALGMRAVRIDRSETGTNLRDLLSPLAVRSAGKLRAVPGEAHRNDLGENHAGPRKPNDP